MVRNFAMAGLAAAALGFAADGAQAQSTVKIGALLPMTGPQQSTGVQITAAMRLYRRSTATPWPARRSRSCCRTTARSRTTPSGSRRS